MTFHEELKMCI